MIAFVDTETLGLDPDRHAIWECAVVLYDPAARVVVSEHVWQLEVSDDELRVAEPIALDIGRWTERRLPPSHETFVSKLGFCRQFAQITAGTHLAGAVVSFDEERIRRLCDRLAVEHAWHYHLIDVEALAIGYLRGKRAGWIEAACDSFSDLDPADAPDPPPVAVDIPWRSNDLTAALGIEVPEESKHTALGDARWALAIYQAVTA